MIFDSDCLIPEDYLEIVKDYLFEHKLDAYGGPDAAHAKFYAGTKGHQLCHDFSIYNRRR